MKIQVCLSIALLLACLCVIARADESLNAIDLPERTYTKYLSDEYDNKILELAMEYIGNLHSRIL